MWAVFDRGVGVSGAKKIIVDCRAGYPSNRCPIVSFRGNPPLQRQWYNNRHHHSGMSSSRYSSFSWVSGLPQWANWGAGDVTPHAHRFPR